MNRIEQLVSRDLLCACTLAVVVAVAAGCGDDPAEPPPVPTTITISPWAATLRSLGETVQLTATVQDQNGQAMTDVTVTWASRDNRVATVGNNGLVTAEGNGMAIVEASVGTVVGTVEATVEQQPTEVRVSPATDTLVALADTLRLSAEAFDANGHPVPDVQFTWTSDDESVVTVEGGGLVTAVGNGEASVTASVESVAGAAVVTVEQRSTEVRISPAADTLVALGDTLRLSAEAFDANGHLVADAGFTWASSDESVVTVDGAGLVTAVGPGGASVTATTAEVAGSAAVTVEQRPFEVRVSPAADTLIALGDTLRLSAEAFDANGHLVPGAQFMWGSDDESVVTVDADGLVTAVENGEASVTAAAESAAGSAAVTVEQRPSEVRVSPGADTLVALGDTLRLSAEAFDANGHWVAGTDFTWASEDEAVVTVDAGGLVTAVGRGGASVTATTADVTGSAAVTVDQRPFEVSLSPGADTLMALGDTVRLSAEALDANGHVVPDTEFTWQSGDTSIVAVDSTALVTAVANGSAEVTASAGEVVGKAMMTVDQRAVEMRVWPEADTLLIEDTLQLSAEAEDANGHLLTHPEFTWSSGDESVAAVDADGLVTGVAAGSVEMKVVEGTAGLTRTVLLLVVEPREELARVYDALGGGGWANSENWGTDAPLDEWYGVTTDGEGHITELDLSDNGLSGAIPPELARLESLEVLDLSENGSMAPSPRAHDPREMAPEFLVPGAEHLPVAAFPSAAGAPDLHMMPERPVAFALQQPAETEPCVIRTVEAGAGLTGPIPPALGALRRLKVLDLSHNSLSGSIPPELGNIESLEELDLGYNQLSGPIPPDLGGLGNLEVLNLCIQWQRDGTQWVGGLTGSIPPELGDLGSLRVLDLTWTSLTGSIPPELGDLGSLQVLDLGFNQLTGSIPAELGDLGSLEAGLSLGYNQLSGPIPPELADLGSLEVLVLGYNSLTGPLPSSLADLQSLRILWVAVTDLEGPIPHDFIDVPLDTFQWWDTNLCAPTDEEFQNWLKGTSIYSPIRLFRLQLSTREVASWSGCLVE